VSGVVDKAEAHCAVGLCTEDSVSALKMKGIGMNAEDTLPVYIFTFIAM
jgi:hypothetical protein